MTTKNDSQSGSQASKRKSLRYHSDQEKPEIPAYLKAVSPSEEEEAFASDKPPSASLTSLAANSSSTTKGVITITMDRTSIFSILLSIMLVGLCFFAMGLLVAFLFFQTPTTVTLAPTDESKIETPAQTEAEAVAAPDKVSTNPDEGARLAEIAQSITGKFDEGKAAVAEGPEIASNKIGDTQKAAEGAKKGQEAIPAQVEAIQKSAEDVKKQAEDLKKVPEAVKNEVGKIATTLPSNLAAGSKKAETSNSFSFAINLGSASAEPEAKAMQTELKKSGIETFITVIPNAEGRPQFHIQTGKYPSYDLAQKAMQALPKPYSLWGKVTKNEPGTAKDRTGGK